MWGFFNDLLTQYTQSCLKFLYLLLIKQKPKTQKNETRPISNKSSDTRI